MTNIIRKIGDVDFPKRKVWMKTFGCQMNYHDSERILSYLKDLNFEQTDIRDDADLIIFNTCAIRYLANSKFYSHLGELKEAKKKRRSSFILLLFHLAITVIPAIVAPNKDGSEFLFLFFPFSVLMANYLQIIKESWFKETVIILFFVLTIVVLSYS